MEDFKQTIGTFGIGAAIFGAAALGFMSTYKIAPGYAGVVYNMDGGVEDNVLPQGYHVVAPWKKVIEYPISTETVYYTKSSDGKEDDDKEDSSINVNTKDGKQVNVSVTYSFHMDAENLPAVFTKFRGRSTEEIEAEKARITAQGKADAAVIEATGQAAANEKLQQSLSDNVIKQHTIEKWDGKLPQYQLNDGNATAMHF